MIINFLTVQLNLLIYTYILKAIWYGFKIQNETRGNNFIISKVFSINKYFQYV